MRIVHLAYYYGNNTSGAPVAAMRLHQALLRRGMDSHFVCVNCREPGINVHPVPGNFILERMFYLTTRAFWVLTRMVFGQIIMPNLIPLWGFARTMRRLNPDVVHVHLISQDMVAFSQLLALKRPMVYTLHDLLIANAVDPYPGSDLRYCTGFNTGNSHWWERWLWRRKLHFVSAASPRFTGPSHWICSCFANSLIGRGREVKFIPNIIDPAYAYCQSDVKAHDKFVMLFGAAGGRVSALKGWPDVVSAIALLPKEMKRNTEILLFGEAANPIDVHGVKVNFLGSLRNPADIRRAHHAADVFLLPSRQDNAPQVKFEALMDGLPVLAFERTGCAEYIEHGVNGWVARDGDIPGYAAGMRQFYEWHQCGELRNRRQAISDTMATSVSESAIVDAFVEQYNQVRQASSHENE